MPTPRRQAHAADHFNDRLWRLARRPAGYNADTGNLLQVIKLADRTAGTYVTNSYLYNNPNFPHYITGIIEQGTACP